MKTSLRSGRRRTAGEEWREETKKTIKSKTTALVVSRGCSSRHMQLNLVMQSHVCQYALRIQPRDDISPTALGQARGRQGFHEPRGWTWAPVDPADWLRAVCAVLLELWSQQRIVVVTLTVLALCVIVRCVSTASSTTRSEVVGA